MNILLEKFYKCDELNHKWDYLRCFENINFLNGRLNKQIAKVKRRLNGVRSLKMGNKLSYLKPIAPMILNKIINAKPILFGKFFMLLIDLRF